MNFKAPFVFSNVNLQGPYDEGAERISYAAMPEPAKRDVWERFHASVEPARQAGKLGCVVFQFHLSFACTEASREHVLSLRRRLDHRINMAVEFRNREWVVGKRGDETCAWLRKHRLVRLRNRPSDCSTLYN